MKASELLVNSLEQEGVEYIFGIPGEENLDMLEALRTSSIELILTRNEQTAVFMAATYGRFTGKPGVAMATLGPGATNMVTGVGYAQLNGLPVVVITGQKPIKKSKQANFQVIDVVSMMKPITKMARQIQHESRIPSLIRQAFKTAMSERPGAVHLEFPEDIAQEDVGAYKPIHQQTIRRPVVEDKAFDQLIHALESAKNPIVLIGAGANRKRVSKYLSNFIEKNNIPFFESQMGKGVVDERLTQYVGTAATSSGDGVHEVVEMADLILAVGHDSIEKPTNFLCEDHQVQVVHLNFYQADMDEVYQPDLEIIGDLGNLFWRLYEHTFNKEWDFTQMYKRAKKYLVSIREHEVPTHGTYVTPQQLVRDLRSTLQEEDILALDNGWYKLWIARNYTACKPNTVLLDNTFATMGAGLSIGMSAKMINQEKNVVVIAGDGGFVMNLGDVETAVRLQNNLTIIVVNNNSYGMIKLKQESMGFEDFGLDLPNPDFVQLAESFGAKGHRVTNPKDFSTILAKAMKEDAVSIIDVPLQYPKGIQ